jgi:PhnB protein
MAEVQLDPYIFFPGNCREAMEFYKGIFGGELTMQSYDEAQGEMKVENSAGKIMHSALEGGLFRIMASDSTTHDKWEKSLISLSISGTDTEQLTKVFDALGEGGFVESPLKKEFWGSTFGAVTDKYGIDWMVNIDESQEAAQ